MAKVLILDQSKSMRNTLRERLEFEGFSTEAAEDEEAASTMCEKIPFDVILSDRGCKIPDAGIPFIVLSAEASIDSAVEAVRNGAQDYLTKPIDMNRLLQSIHRTIDNPAPAPACAPAAAPARRSRRSRNMHTEQIIGTSPQMEHVRQLIDKVAPCEARVLITGENGTGKELVARWLHAKSNRAAAPFVEVNCAAIPSELIEIGEFRITPQSIGIIIISLAIITGLHFFFTKVKIGKCMQLANSDPEGAAMMGVNVTYMRFLTFGISAALACIAGVMIAPLTYARVDMSATIGMKAFAAAILGGIGNLRGSVIAATVLTVLPELLRSMNDYRMLIYAIVLIVVMIFNQSPQMIAMRKRLTARFRKDAADKAPKKNKKEAA